MKINYFRPFNRYRTTYARIEQGSVEVKQNQAITPAQIADLTAHGMAVSSSNNLQFEEGVANPGPVPLEQLRGIDVVDVWDASMTASKKLRSFAKSQTSQSNQ